jgi:hypothetical protein
MLLLLWDFPVQLCFLVLGLILFMSVILHFRIRVGITIYVLYTERRVIFYNN